MVWREEETLEWVCRDEADGGNGGAENGIGFWRALGMRRKQRGEETRRSG